MSINLMVLLSCVGGHIFTSVCPTLGQKYAQIYDGFCPKDAQNPAGKSLKISFMGHPPHIIHEPISGSDFMIVGLLADKLNFIPEYVKEQSLDILNINGKTLGMVHAVRNLKYVLCMRPCEFDNFQVLTKQSEIGIGQIQLVHHNYKFLEYLHYMYEQPYVLVTAKPREISSYNTISYPFDIYTWVFTYSLIITQFVLLLVMQNLWSNALGKNNPQDYIYQGCHYCH